jgi:hypothetical protein
MLNIVKEQSGLTRTGKTITNLSQRNAPTSVLEKEGT